VLRHGHRLTLYCYDVPEGVPEGVELADAEAIVPRSRVIRYPGGSPSIFANRFRYELQRRGLGTWVDSDVYLLKPLDLPGDYLLGREDDLGTVNSAVMRLPADSPLLPPLLALFEDRSVPPWLPLRARMAARWRLALNGRAGVETMPWGSTGPAAMTALLAKMPVANALPKEVLYPVPWQEAEWICDPASSLIEKTTPGTIAVHLWNERIKHLKDRPAPARSFLARLQSEGA
jgi:hypothetical protein